MTRPLIFPSPEVRRKPEGNLVSLKEICWKAKIPMRLTQSHGPDIYIHSAATSFVVPRGSTTPTCLCISDSFLAPSGRQRWVNALEVLAYQFHDWAAREVLAAERRFLLRECHERLVHKGFEVSEGKIMGSVALTREALESDLSEGLRMDEFEVRSSVQSLFEKEILENAPERSWGKPIWLTLKGRRVITDTIDEMMLEEK
jgi:hypothetical protein